MSKTTNSLRFHWPALLILLSFLALGLTYSLIVPPFEAGDESRHYAVVKYMADTGRLPLQDEAIAGDAMPHWEHEGNQPPLYYALAALLTAPIETGTWGDVFRYNPHTTIGTPLREDNKSITLHPTQKSWTGHVLAVHLIRLLSLSLAALTVLTSYHIALTLFNGRRDLALGAMALTAFNPMFIFISASVNNDNAVILFVTLALWLMVRGQSPTARLLITLGLLIGLGGLSKLYALGLLPLVGLWLIGLNYRPTVSLMTACGRATRQGFIVGLTALLVCGWFYLRNAWLYQGDFLALQAMREAAGTRTDPLTLSRLWAEFEGLRIAYWALFGGVNILVADWIYSLLDGLMGLGLLGLLLFGGRVLRGNLGRLSLSKPTATGSTDPQIHLPTCALLLGWCLIMVAGFLVWNLTQPATQGRLFYPAIAAISALLMLGLWEVYRSGKAFCSALIARYVRAGNRSATAFAVPEEGGQQLRQARPAEELERPRQIALAMLIGGLFAFAALTPWLTLAPVYSKPPPLSTAEVPPQMQPVNLTYDGTVRLLGYQLHTPTVRPGETLELTLFWQLLRPTATDYSLFIHVLGRQREKVTQRDTYPGGGHWPTTMLQAGDIVADEYRIDIPPQIGADHAPTQLLIAAGIYDYHEAGRPGRAAVNEQGQVVEPVITRAKLIPWRWPSIEPKSTTNPVTFAERVTLWRYDLDPTAETLTLTWQVQQPLDADYTVFIQAWSEGAMVRGFDGPPVRGDYPTSLWATGETIVDVHSLSLADLPSDSYLLVGLYHPQTGARLPAWDVSGVLSNYAVRVEW